MLSISPYYLKFTLYKFLIIYNGILYKSNKSFEIFFCQTSCPRSQWNQPLLLRIISITIILPSPLITTTSSLTIDDELNLNLCGWNYWMKILCYLRMVIVVHFTTNDAHIFIRKEKEGVIRICTLSFKTPSPPARRRLQ